MHTSSTSTTASADAGQAGFDPEALRAATPHRTLDAPGMACIDLTPLIAKAMRDLQPGEVLEVHTDDPAARVGVPAWCRLTGNRLVHTSGEAAQTDDNSTQTTFHIAKKES